MNLERPCRLASAVYRRSLRRLDRALPLGSTDEAVQVFEDLQRDAVRSGGWWALGRCWINEAMAIRALRQSLLAPSGAVTDLGAERMAMVRCLGHDFRDAWRYLRNAPWYSTLVIATLALGIGMNTAIFSVADAVLFKALPYADPDRLVVVSEVHSSRGRNAVAPANFLDWRSSTRSFTYLEARSNRSYALLDGGDPLDVPGADVSVGYFDMLGVRIEAGRAFNAADGLLGAPCTVVMSHRLFAARFAADPRAIGRPVRFSGQVCTLIGVLPAGSVFDQGVRDVYTPMSFGPGLPTRTSHTLSVLGRLAPGASVETANQEMQAVARSIVAAHPELVGGWSASVEQMRDVVVRGDTRQLVWVLFGAVGLVLLVACVNIAGLSLSRTAARHREVAIRTALGSSRWRVFRSFLVEALTLSMAGGIAGVFVGRWSLAALVAALPPRTLPAEAIAALDLRALLFTGGVAVLVGVISGTLPAWQGARTGVADGLRAGGRAVSGSRLTSRLHATLLVAEVALAMTLVVGATLLAVSFVHLTAVRPGFDSTNVMTLHISLPESRYKNDSETAMFFERTLGRIRQMPRVQSAGAVTSLPLNGWLYGETFSVQGMPADPGHPTSAHLQLVTAGYFETLRIPLVAGRSFTSRDDGRGMPAVIVNQTLVRLYMGGAPAVGRHIRLGTFPTPLEVVGVIQDVKTGGLDDPDLKTPEIYGQKPVNTMFIAVRVAPGTMIAPADFRAAVRAIDPELPAADVLSMDERIGLSTTMQRFRTMMFIAFAALAGLLAALGVYAIRSQTVAARLREVGIRLALGATPGHVMRFIILQGLRLVGAGLCIGLIASIGLTRYIQQWLFGTRTTDPVVVATPLLLLGSAALLASWLPARRAARVDPLKILRQD